MNCHYHPEVSSSAFCQFCGKPLCKDCVRNVGGAVYCEACLAERLRATGAPTVPFSTGTPHPLLAGLLGFIPGVGAMYNGQYAKAIAHVLIFAVLASLGDKSSIFGILVAAWVFYQVFDAYQTAIARRDGLPLPNPFGLNDIAQRIGIHAHPGAPVPPAAAYGAKWEPAAGQASTGYVSPEAGSPGSVHPGSVNPGPGNPGSGNQGASWGAVNPGASGFVPPASYGAASGYSGQTYAGRTGYVPPATPGQSYTPMGTYDPYPDRRDLPVGAIVLIGLGIMFLFGSLGLLHGAWVSHLWPLLIIGLGIWIIIRRTRSVPPAAVRPADPAVHSDPTGGVR